MTDLETLRKLRAKLTTTLCNCDSGAFPGSRAARAESAAIAALAAFDDAHPEVIAAIQSDQVGPGAARALHGED